MSDTARLELPVADQLPAELLTQPRWCCWKLEWNASKGKFDKPPYSPVTGQAIGAVEKNRDHFLPFEEAIAGARKYGLNVGHVFIEGDGFCGLDFDKAVKDGVIDPDVERWLRWFPEAYKEFSPSGNGIHVICRATISKAVTATRLSATSAATVEIYDRGRYFTVTGNRLGEAVGAGDCQLGVSKLLSHIGESEKRVTSSVASAAECPWSIFTARRVYSDNLESLRNAIHGAGNATLNTVAFFAARAFAAGALEGTEISIKRELFDIVTREWKSPHDEHGARSTIESGWNSGSSKPLTLIDWKKKFHIGSELETGDVKLHIDKILPEGVTAIASLSAVGKTWFALSMARALTTGTKFLGVFDVPESVPVIYLVPEMGSRALRKRLERMNVPMNEHFYSQTVGDGICELGDALLEAAVKELKPVVFLDTAVRFNPSDDENSARQNASMLASHLFRIVKWGARAVVALHHSPKYSGTAEYMTLENALRGTGDLGAMCDCVWGLQHDKRKAANGRDWDFAYLEESQSLSRLFVKCVKPRDFDPAPAFRIQGRPYIDEKGDFVVLAESGEGLETRILTMIEENPRATVNEIMDRFKLGHNRLQKITRAAGWESPRGRKGTWQKVDQGISF